MKLKIKDENVMGCILIIAGVCLVIYGIVLVFSISQGFEVPIDIFNVNYEATDIDYSLDANQYNMLTPNDYFKQIFTPLFPMFNFMMWISIVFFIVRGGISTIRIGIKMLKTSIELNEITKYELEDVTNISYLLKHKY